MIEKRASCQAHQALYSPNRAAFISARQRGHRFCYKSVTRQFHAHCPRPLSGSGHYTTPLSPRQNPPEKPPQIGDICDLSPQQPVVGSGALEAMMLPAPKGKVSDPKPSDWGRMTATPTPPARICQEYRCVVKRPRDAIPLRAGLWQLWRIDLPSDRNWVILGIRRSGKALGSGACQPSKNMTYSKEEKR